MSAAFSDPHIVKDYDLVGAEDGRQPVGYCDRGPAPGELLEAVLNEAFTFIIKYQYGRILQEYSRYGNVLFLSSGKPGSTLSDQCIKTFRQFLQKIQQIGIFGRFKYILIRCIRPAVGNVLSDGPIEKIDIRIVNDSSNLFKFRFIRPSKRLFPKKTLTSAGNLLF